MIERNRTPDGKFAREESPAYIYITLYRNAYGFSNVCEVCSQQCLTHEFVIHHIDHNHDNNVLNNLQGLCRKCHASEHHLGAIRSKETRKNISVGLNKYHQTVDSAVLAARGACAAKTNRVRGHFGKKKHSKFGDLQRVAQTTLRQRVCYTCGMISNAGSLTRHANATGHEIGRALCQ